MKIFRLIPEILKKIRHYLRKHAQQKHERLILKGIHSTCRACTGPLMLELDLTDQCMNTCLACWVHSPLLKIKKAHKKHILFHDLKHWLHDFKKAGIEEIRLAGAGDPMNHPQILDILKELKKNNFKVCLNTSLLPLPENFAELLTDIRLDDLTLSLWAGNSGEWTLMHPKVPEDHFQKISSFLLELEKYKKEKNTVFPRTRIYNVITSMNSENLSGMLQYAVGHFSDRIEFQVADIFPDIRELTLKPDQILDIKKQIKALYSFPGYTDEFIGNGNRLHLEESPDSQEQKEFGRFYHPVENGFTWKSAKEILCPRGLNYIRKSWTHDHPYPAFHYEYDTTVCSNCSRAPLCYPHPKSVPLCVRFTNLTGIGTFLRRLESLNTHSSMGETDKSAVLNTPCLAPWYYGRILSDGQFIPCCKASKMPMGNLYHTSFKKIWFGKNMNEFRQKAYRISENYSYFSAIQCIKGCDNLGENLNWGAKAFSISKKQK